ncbi:unnamed protein product [Cladocopium goreaui]|uniref:Uncharacterized protein n=1 Tax=Cladocopium goreaui TaxID=2562237 RepID=A0A9P1DE50_9DINO|nr:unnamed protein product [Cladocopium goreaui]
MNLIHMLTSVDTQEQEKCMARVRRKIAEATSSLTCEGSCEILFWIFSSACNSLYAFRFYTLNLLSI